MCDRQMTLKWHFVFESVFAPVWLDFWSTIRSSLWRVVWPVCLSSVTHVLWLNGMSYPKSYYIIVKISAIQC